MRAFLSIVLPVLLPFAVYLVYLRFAYRRVRAAQARGETVKPVDVPWSWLAAAGVVLLAVSLAVEFMYGGSTPGSVYEPARIEGGKIVPGQLRERPN